MPTKRIPPKRIPPKRIPPTLEEGQMSVTIYSI